MVFFEAGYYLSDLEATIDEVMCVLTPGRTGIFVNGNPERQNCIRSPHTGYYHSAIHGALPACPAELGFKSIVVDRLARVIPERLGLAPPGPVPDYKLIYETGTRRKP